MLDFYKISFSKKGKVGSEYYEVLPDFKVRRCEDLMVRGGAFYAVWNQEQGLWSTDEYEVQRMIDRDLHDFAEKLREEHGIPVKVRYLKDFSSSSWSQFQLFVSKLPEHYHQLDTRVAFSNTEVLKQDYISKRLPYPLEEGDTPAFDSLFTILYDDENLTKIMWAIGSVLTGDSKRIQKFFVLFGLPGTGKSTTLNLIEKLLGGHVTPFEAAVMTNSNSGFALESFKDNPLVAIDHEGDLSKIRNNSVITSVVSHDKVVMNIKYQHPFSIRLNTMLFIATNKPVMITDRASGIIRRLVDIRPTGRIVSPREYEISVNQMNFELGAIASKCIELYNQLGKNHYNRYVPLDMIYRTNVFFNFVDEHYLEFAKEDMVTLSRAWELYKKFCEDTGITGKMARHAFRDELKNYWREFHAVTRIEGVQTRSVYVGFNKEVFTEESTLSRGKPFVYDWLSLSEQPSVFDRDQAEQPAQLASKHGPPRYTWENVTTTLGDIDTSKLHYIIPKEQLITIDFDMKDANGQKSLELNIKAARSMPPTYAEASKSGEGLHLHYYYDGDISKLSRIFSPGIEILKPSGNFSIRRRLSVCNNHAIATINSGLPLKPDKGDSMIDKKTLSNERSLRTLLLRNLHKEIHPATKPSVDFMEKILFDAYESGMRYDVSDMKPYILNFASNSTNNAQHCIEVALGMKYKSDHSEEEDLLEDDSRLAFFDVEVFSNYLIICWKFEHAESVVAMINPTASEVEALMKQRLIGFNNRRYDNHILYAAYMGYDTEQIHQLSQRIIENDRSALFREAYGISYADVYDYSMVKQSLKKWEVDLGIPHNELDVDWNSPLPEELLEKAIEYCKDDVRATEAVHHDRAEDFQARLILSELSGLSVNSSTRSHTAKIIFGNDRNHKSEFVYPDLSLEFPGYVFDKGKSSYRGEDPSEGGYVYAEPGMYNNVVYLDVASMHPTSIIEMNLFGKYTKRFAELKDARVSIKDSDLDSAGLMFDGRLAKFLVDAQRLPRLSHALKIALNMVYGDTAASFDNPFKDIRNRDNVVAKRGALFMIDLKHALWERGCKPIHFKTDSVKIADFTQEDVDFVMEFGKKYGYTFGVEGVYERLVLTNDAVLIGKWDKTHKKHPGKWEPVGARFAHPYVYKKLFSKEEVTFEDKTEVRSVKAGTMYIEQEDGTMEFIGRVGVFCPMKNFGGVLYRVQNDKKYAVTGTSGYLWTTAEVVRGLNLYVDIDLRYFEGLVDDALEEIAKFGDANLFIGE